MDLLDEIKKAIKLVEERPSENPEEYAEAVFESKDLDALISVVQKNLGESIKPAGKKAKLDRNVNKLADSIGGLRIEQSFYCKQEPDGRYIYVALWPWQSDPSKITLKLGKERFV